MVKRDLIRIGIIGTGRIGKLHVEIAAHETPGATVVAVSDVNEATARSVADEIGVECRGVDELIASDDIDAIAICTSTDTHVDLIIMAAQAGKAIFCEKPLSLDLVKVDAALMAVKVANVPLMVGFNRRFDPGHQSVHEAILSGKVGKVQITKITSRDPAPPPLEYLKVSGGIFIDMMIHDFDLARYLVGSPIVEIFAKGSIMIDSRFTQANDVDTAVVVLTHESGAITVIDNSRQAVYGYDQRVEVFGSAAMALSENQRIHNATLWDKNGVFGQNPQHFFLERYRTAYQNEWAAFTKYVTQGGESPVSGDDGRAPIVLGLAAWESLRSGKPVKVDGV
ncbi:MAG: inositol 2-dehydrogenase [Actinomycetota bacterium]